MPCNECCLTCKFSSIIGVAQSKNKAEVVFCKDQNDHKMICEKCDKWESRTDFKKARNLEIKRCKED